jgi:hypothetical protein
VVRARPALSLCAVTDGTPSHAHAFLTAWRPVVDELVVAVDERADPRTRDVVADIADKLLVAPPVANMERYLGWLHGQCSGDWILRVDDDELPSAALSGGIRDLIAEPEPTHYWLPRQWPHPSPREYIDQGMWGFDIQVRLVRSVPGIWRFSGRPHSNIEVLGASRVTDAPLLHVVTLLRTLEERRRKGDFYDAIDADFVHESGLRGNAIYVPEEYPELRRAPMAPADVQTVERFLAGVRGPAPPSPPLSREVERPSQLEIERWLTDRSASPGAYRAKVRIVDPVPSMPAGAVRHIRVEITNLGDEWWPRGPNPAPEILVGHRWFRSDGSPIENPMLRTALTESVAPGATTRLTVPIQAPPEAGDLEVNVDMVHEWVRWFDCGDAQLVHVRSRP